MVVENLIIGGGISGLWLNALLVSRGRRSFVISQSTYNQTKWSQGILHSGAKYGIFSYKNPLKKDLSVASQIWRNSLDGKGSVNLSNTQIVSTSHCLVSTKNLVKKIIFPVLKNIYDCDEKLNNSLLDYNKNLGLVTLNEMVLDVDSLVDNLLTYQCVYKGSVFKIDVKNKKIILMDGTNISANKIFILSGKGAESIFENSEINIRIQKRPLAMLRIFGDDLPPVFCHVIGYNKKPLASITSKDNYWYIGGDVAELGVNLDDENIFSNALSLLAEIFPTINFSNRCYDVIRVCRAEALHPSQSRPSRPSIIDLSDDVCVGWPTKLTLAPVLAEQLYSRSSCSQGENLTDTALEPIVKAE